MRNISQDSVQIVTLRTEDVERVTPDGTSATFAATAFDVDRGVTFAATTCGGEILIWKTAGRRLLPPEESSFCFCGSYATPDPRIVSLRVLAESRRLVLVTRSGDIVVWELGDSGDFNSDADVIGAVETGILAVSWSPDDSFVVLATDGNVILMNSMFDVLSEVPWETSEFGEDAPINVGWGSKATQFHGSAGRAHLKTPEKTNDQQESVDDDNLPRITWRGDGAYFAVSTRSSRHLSPRVVRVYSHEGRLQSTSEPVPGLEANVAWKPNGSLIASTQFDVRSGPQDTHMNGNHYVVFFERNGLRHGEFSLRRPLTNNTSFYRVKDLLWSPDSAILAVWIEHTEGDTVQLWTSSNYHWKVLYLKQEIYPQSASRFTTVTWHPEHSSELVLTTSSRLIVRRFVWETCAGASDTGCVGVVDGDHILLTPFRTQNVPPPMSSHQLPVRIQHTAGDTSPSFLRSTPSHVSLSSINDILGAVWGDGRVIVWSLHTRIGPGTGKVMNPILLWTKDLGHEDVLWRQVQVSVLAADAKERILQVAILGSTEQSPDLVNVHEVRLSPTEEQARIGETCWTAKLSGKDGRLMPDLESLSSFWQSREGEIFRVDSTEEAKSSLCNFPEFCFSGVSFLVQARRLFVGLSSSGKLYCTTEGSKPAELTDSANSFTVASGFVVFTTNTHEVHFAPVAMLVDHLINRSLEEDGPLTSNQVAADTWEKRRVERGSRIVTVVPGTMSLVLQMPRGNLETISPRPLVMEAVKDDLDAGRWQKGFLACRKHRINLSVIVEHNEEAFMAGISRFIEQIEEVDYINLFLSSIGQSELSAKTISDVCDAVRFELQTKDLRKYVNSILTAYVVKTPPDYESGLTLLLQLRDLQPERVEDAVKYIIFLVDADKLFETALGMYDFSLVLLVAQHAQKDPREYLPFLRELRALPPHYQRFRIDDYLRRYEKALRNLHLAGPTYFQEALDYIERHQLYEAGLEIWKGMEQYRVVLGVYGSWLFERRDYRQAALVFVEASDLRKAMVAHERALEWQELFQLSTREVVPEDEVIEIAFRIAGELLLKKRYSEAARVFIDYAGDNRQAVTALVQGNEISEARRIVSLHGPLELLQEVILPGALDIKAQLTEELNEMREQLHKQLARLRELRTRKVQEPDTFYGTEQVNMQNIDVMTDISMAPTAFTRYTAAPTATSKVSKRSSKTKRKMERKVGSGRKGTVDEEEYILKSVTKLVARCGVTQVEVQKLLPHLLHFSELHRSEACVVQQDMEFFERELRDSIEEIWQSPSTTENPAQDSWAKRMLAREKERLVDPLERVSKPVMESSDWGIGLLRAKTNVLKTAGSSRY
ncbi:pol II transcription elongation factor [Pisolithus orientalis]|uniref:pol II transcription elongation factor n=1 Tax=Pisolithus orientalis TaxID=936130 RepID=UPI002223FB53|nr:pol II transcription elongation factor [Pisolithus orientalis]KAI6007771.1 pol II transcription elongation factor [Pisolithus orientalis]